MTVVCVACFREGVSSPATTAVGFRPLCSRHAHPSSRPKEDAMPEPTRCYFCQLPATCIVDAFAQPDRFLTRPMCDAHLAELGDFAAHVEAIPQ